MKKHIYITEDIAEQLSNIIQPIEHLPSDILNVLKNHKTSLGIHPAFPPEEEIPFDMLLTKQRFEEIRSKVITLDLDNYSFDGVQKHLNTLLKQCKEIEANNKKQLENICFNHIIDLFEVPDGIVSFTCTLVDKVNDGKAQSTNTETFEFNDIRQRSKLHDEVYKRRIINAIITGGAMRLSAINKTLIGELYELSPELPKLYKDITLLNEYLLFTKNNMGISDKDKKQSGISYLTIGNEHTKNQIVAEAEIFPFLLHESIRAFLEMFAAYGLPTSKSECAYVMSKADFINAEPWDMRLGPALWDKLMEVFDNPPTQNLPMLFTIFFSQRTFKFNNILREILGDTKMGKRLAQKILDKTNEEIDSCDFEETMCKKQTETSIINDQYYIPDEL
jgi:hypothetical protein